MSTEKLRIAKIINDTSIVINGGTNKNVKKGQKYQIVGKEGANVVTDPVTKESLGTLDELKGNVIIKTVYPKMAIAETEKTRSFNTINSGLARGVAANALYGSVKQKTLNVDRNQITGGELEEASPVQIGDFVRLIN